MPLAISVEFTTKTARSCVNFDVANYLLLTRRSQIDLLFTFAPPPASGAGAARRVNLLIVVIPAQNAALGRQVAKARHVRPLLTLPEHNFTTRHWGRRLETPFRDGDEPLSRAPCPTAAPAGATRTATRRTTSRTAARRRLLTIRTD